MIIYESLKEEFIDHVKKGIITSKIIECYQQKKGKPNEAEIRAWNNSISAMGLILINSTLPNNVGVAIEFVIPMTGNRIDFILSGYDENDTSTIIIIELKQWSKAERVLSKDGIIKTNIVGSMVGETNHPSYQAWSYKMLIKDFNENVQKNKIDIFPCAYLHNYRKQYENEIRDDHYSYYLNQAPVFLQDESVSLNEFLQKYIKKGDNKKNLYEINNGNLRPSKSLQDALSSMINGNSEFIMIDSQKEIYEEAFYLGAQCQKDKKKRVMIVEGGPGTGKSVIAINLLAKFNNKGYITQYVSKNASPRNVYEVMLKGDKKQTISPLFQSSGKYYHCKKDSFPILIIDEAHRLNEKSGLFKNLGENQIKELINCSKFSVFFIDENQRIDIHDIGSVDEIKKFANQLNAELSFYKLKSQFRCNGSDGYLSWLDDILEIKDTANFDGFNLDYDFKIFEDPNELRKAIEEKNKVNNKSRLVAGYCWDWIKEGKNDSNVYDINIKDFKISWNLGNTSIWAIDSESVKEAGCIHTCQGLEFDYVGVIIGPDIRFDGEKIITDYNKRAKTDQSLKGIKSIAVKNPEKAKLIADEIIKNTYRTLMTRGQKGCYIYCVDKSLSGYFKNKLDLIKRN